MKLNYAPQAGLRRRRPDHHRERYAFWAGIGIAVVFELILMAKSAPRWEDIQWPWSEASAPLGDPDGGGGEGPALPSQAD